MVHRIDRRAAVAAGRWTAADGSPQDFAYQHRGGFHRSGQPLHSCRPGPA